MAEAVQFCDAAIVKRTPIEIITANAEMVMQALSNASLYTAMRDADLVIPDGAGVVLAAKRYGKSFPESVAGYDLAQQLLALAARKGYRVYLLGASPGVAGVAASKAVERYPGLIVAGVRDGYFDASRDQEIVDELRAANVDILLVALGVPRQELWIKKHKQVLGIPVCIGVGGTLDVMAGIVKRAPLWMQRSHIEWLYRLLKQPSRFMRMLNLPKFVLRVMFSK